MEQLLNARSKEELVKLVIGYREQNIFLQGGRAIERFDEMEAELETLHIENEKLKNELASRPIHAGLPGAGRKRKASDADVAIIKKLAAQGFSLSEIAIELEAQTGTRLSRSTVRNMINI